jgi:DNA-binding NtrC family response regulator
MPEFPAPAAPDRTPAITRRDGTRGHILIVEDDAAMREMLREALEDDHFVVETAADGRQGVDRVRKGGIDLVVSDVKMPDLDGLDLLREIKAVTPSPHVITITAFGSIDTAIRAVKLGAFDYITKPFQVDQLLLSVEKALAERELRSEVARLRDEVQRSYRFDNIIGRAPAMQEVFELIRRLSGSAASVLITGESGTGKELVAKSIHWNSPRKDRPFVAVNCAAIPDTLLESELFGYKRGAFTDARADRPGIFVEAEGGTIFLDEIAELSPSLQAKLLRVLQDGEVRRVGENVSRRVDVRIVAATNRRLAEEAAAGRFRTDLRFRLDVVRIDVPPLRDRASDVPLLAARFWTDAAGRVGSRATLSPDAMAALARYDWPGNVRELQNVIASMVVQSPRRGRVGPTALPAHLTAVMPSAGVTFEAARTEFERRFVRAALATADGQRTQAAETLGVTRQGLAKMLRRLGLD